MNKEFEALSQITRSMLPTHVILLASVDMLGTQAERATFSINADSKPIQRNAIMTLPDRCQLLIKPLGDGLYSAERSHSDDYDVRQKLHEYLDMGQRLSVAQPLCAEGCMMPTAAEPTNG